MTTQKKKQLKQNDGMRTLLFWVIQTNHGKKFVWRETKSEALKRCELAGLVVKTIRPGTEADYPFFYKKMTAKKQPKNKPARKSLHRLKHLEASSFFQENFQGAIQALKEKSAARAIFNLQNLTLDLPAEARGFIGGAIDAARCGDFIQAKGLLEHAVKDDRSPERPPDDWAEVCDGHLDGEDRGTEELSRNNSAKGQGGEK